MTSNFSILKRRRGLTSPQVRTGTFPLLALAMASHSLTQGSPCLVARETQVCSLMQFVISRISNSGCELPCDDHNAVKAQTDATCTPLRSPQRHVLVQLDNHLLVAHVDQRGRSRGPLLPWPHFDIHRHVQSSRLRARRLQRIR